MKKLLPYFFVLGIISCTNAKQSHNSEIAAKKGAPIYLEEDLPFIRKADSICRTIDHESIFEHTKDGIVTDRDGQKYPVQYRGYSKTSSDSVDKFLANVLFGGKNSGKTTCYYYNGGVIKAISEIFADDIVKTAFYYDGDKMVYPRDAGMEDRWEQTAGNVRDQCISWKTFFLPNK